MALKAKKRTTLQNRHLTKWRKDREKECMEAFSSKKAIEYGREAAVRMKKSLKNRRESDENSKTKD